MNSDTPSWIAFAQSSCIASGTPREVAAKVKRFADAHADAGVLIFDAHSSHPIELDLRGSEDDVLDRLPAEATEPIAPRTRGRPKLGVTAREVTLLPRHWEWLASQPGGASVALRKLVEQAQRANRDSDRTRLAQESTYRFMSAIAGDAPGYEEATRALFANDLPRLRENIAGWPRDVREHTLALAMAAADETREQ